MRSIKTILLVLNEDFTARIMFMFNKVNLCRTDVNWLARKSMTSKVDNNTNRPNNNSNEKNGKNVENWKP